MMKFITVFLCIVMSTLSVRAAAETTRGTGRNAPFTNQQEQNSCYTVVGNSGGNIITVWFYFGQKKLVGEQSSCQTELQDKINEIKGRLTCPGVSLVGSADKIIPTEASAQNYDFAKGRVDWVKKNLLDDFHIVGELEYKYETYDNNDGRGGDPTKRYVQMSFKEAEGQCEDTPAPVVMSDPSAYMALQTTQVVDHSKIKIAAQNLQNIEDTFFDTSKWVGKDGKFNTARLASDLTAGVVLGTTGGVVTSVLMKKGQVKQGFEKLRCTIGGQTVASWGDEFTVGIR